METSRWPAELHPRLVPFPIVLLLTALPADARGGPEVAFHTMFPKPGRYKLWGQFKRDGKIIVADFVVNVEEPLVAKANTTAATATTNAKAEEYKQTDLPFQAEFAIAQGGGFFDTVGEDGVVKTTADGVTIATLSLGGKDIPLQSTNVTSDAMIVTKDYGELLVKMNHASFSCTVLVTPTQEAALRKLLPALTLPDVAFGQETAKDFVSRGNAKKANGDFDGTIAEYTKAIELDPKNAEAYLCRGVAKDDRHDLDGAIADYSKAIELKPQADIAYTNRGYAKKAKGDQAGAEADFAQAAKLRGN